MAFDTAQVHREWATRPAEQRFVSLTDMLNYNREVYHSSATGIVQYSDLRAVPFTDDPDQLAIVGKSGKEASISNWAFQQLVGVRLESYPSMVSRMPAKLASDVINWRLGEMPKSDKFEMLIHRADGTNLHIRAVTSEDYGRIWNYQVLNPLHDRFGDGLTGDWKVPGINGIPLDKVTKENTTFFGSDKDMHVTLADEEHKIELPNRRNGKTGQLSKFFIVGNSEVGGGRLYLAAGLYDHFCGNRLIWGLEDAFEVRINHSKTAPERWMDEIAPAIEAYGHAKASTFETKLLTAQATKVDNVEETLVKHLSKSIPVTQKMTKAIFEAFKTEENRPMETVWDMVTGVTAFAKSIPYTSERVPVERAAGKLIELVANK